MATNGAGLNPHVDTREYLAAERTLLAYIRTALALMGFGFIVARFSLFLRELRLVRPDAAIEQPELSLWFGTALVVIGVLLNAVSVIEYRSLVAKLNQAHSAQVRPAHTPIATALLVAACGAAMTFYLILIE
jgi:putative membrane protein